MTTKTREFWLCIGMIGGVYAMALLLSLDTDSFGSERLKWLLIGMVTVLWVASGIQLLCRKTDG